MQAPDLDPNRSAEALFDDIAAYVAEAATRLDAGEYLDLAALNPAVDTLCLRVQALRVDEAQFFVPKLETLQKQLDALGAVMEEVKTQLADEIGAADKRQKANRAYRPAEKP